MSKMARGGKARLPILAALLLATFAAVFTAMGIPCGSRSVSSGMNRAA